MKIQKKNLFNDGKAYLNHPWSLYPKTQHYVIATDYDHFAIVYGCEEYLFPFGHVKYATLLSRTEFLEYPYVRAAKNFLQGIEYPFGTNWVKPGIDCGFDASLTLDEVMMAVFEHEPWWPHYNEDMYNTRRMKVMFQGDHLQEGYQATGDINAIFGYQGITPFGFLSGPLSWPDN